MAEMTLSPGGTRLEELESIYRQQASVKLDRTAKAGVDAASEQIARAVSGGCLLYTSDAADE